MKYFSKEQIFESLDHLAPLNQFYGLTFLAAKQACLPVAKMANLSLDALNKKFLQSYYTLDPRSKYFFRVFRFNNKNQFWLRPDYAGKGLQKMNTTSFKEAFIHERKSKSWGWSPRYVDFLSQKLQESQKVPAFDLAVWFFREYEWDDGIGRKDIIKKFFSEFNITGKERTKLFSSVIETELTEEEAFGTTLVTWQEIETQFSPPPDVGPEKGGILSYLEMEGIGPVSPLAFDPGRRLNIITGDNGLGKSFLLEVAWWALTGRWAGTAAYPNRAPRIAPKAEIKFLISNEISGKTQTIKYKPSENVWPEPKERATISGLIVYARVDGSFAIWDPAGSSTSPDDEKVLIFNREEVWDGKPGRIEGLIRDWTKWQDKPIRYPFDVFKQILARLSPPEMGKLQPSEPVRLPPDPREIPTIKHSYGDVPILHESAGVRRIVTLAYLIVWTWNEHKIISDQLGRKIENRMVVIVDEIEAHLHPRWQRSILPAILDVAELLSSKLEMQFMIATHSPLVLASAEPVFNSLIDKLFHLDTKHGGKVTFSEMPFLKYGLADSWLRSKVFDLGQARSRDAEEAIKRAIALQHQDKPNSSEIAEVTHLLSEHLPSEDRFWPRWVFFAQDHGVELD